MYGAEWLVVLGLLGLAMGLGGGYLLAHRRGVGSTRVRELEVELDSARREHADYQSEVVAQFSETARKFQTLNDSYTDLHQQLARSSSILCGDVGGPLLAAPSGHQDLLPVRVREAETADGDHATPPPPRDDGAPPEAGPADLAQEEEPPTLRERVEPAPSRQREEARSADVSSEPPEAGADIRVAEPKPEDVSAADAVTEDASATPAADAPERHASRRA